MSASFKLKYFPNSPNVVVMEFSARMVMVAGPIPGIYPYNAVEVVIMNTKFRMHSTYLTQISSNRSLNESN